jgi:hypothetical protein
MLQLKRSRGIGEGRHRAPLQCTITAEAAPCKLFLAYSEIEFEVVHRQRWYTLDDGFFICSLVQIGVDAGTEASQINASALREPASGLVMVFYQLHMRVHM